MAKSAQSTNVNERPYKEAGAFLKRKRKDMGYRTQKMYIKALKEINPDISCSEPYISLIEKGVKTPALKLFNIMAEVLELTPTEKGELLLDYKRVPRDFEFAVRDNLKEASRTTQMDRIREEYDANPSLDTFKHLLTALVLQKETKEALELLKKAPTFENEVQELQLRTAQIASLSGNYEFAVPAFNLALAEAKTPETRADIIRYLGIHYFQQGLHVQDDNPVHAMEFYLQALDAFTESLQSLPEDIFVIDEYARCAYNVGDVLQFLYKHKQLKKPAKKDYPHYAEAYGEWFNGRPTRSQVDARAHEFFEQSRAHYEQVIQSADRKPLPEKAMQEALFFHAYVYGKLERFEEARLFIHSNMLLKPNWLTLFMKSGLSIMEYESKGDDAYLEQALDYLKEAAEENHENIRQMIQDEKQRELKPLWDARTQEMKRLLHAK